MKHDLTGKQFGLLTVIERVAGKYAPWLCRCSGCGGEKIFIGSNLRRGMKHCGCQPRAWIQPFEDMTGKRYGRLLVLRRVPPGEVTITSWVCQCECGKTCIAPAHDLRAGRQVSCGCYRIEAATRRVQTHGLSKTSEHIAWLSMKQRCFDVGRPDWKDYGGRGITVCDRWKNNFLAFLEDVGKKPGRNFSLDRIDNDRNYEPGNVRWSTPREQVLNRRSHERVMVDRLRFFYSEAT